MLKDPAAFVARDAEGKLPGALLDVMEKRGMGRDISWLSYFYTGDDEAFDRGITEAVTQTLGLETRQANTNAVRWVSQYIRDPAPVRIVWDLSTRAQMREKNTFYWLKADPSVDRGIITASYDVETNRITVEPDENVNGDFAILFHPALIDVSRPVTIRTPKNECVLQIRPSAEYLRASMGENGDPELACIGEVLYSAICSPE